MMTERFSDTEYLKLSGKLLQAKLSWSPAESPSLTTTLFGIHSNPVA